jgi:hypothetical protein
MSDQRSDTIRTAAVTRTRDAQTRARKTLRALEKAGIPVSFASVASAAGVSRQFLYTQPELREEVERLRSDRQAVPRLPARTGRSDDGIRARLRAALEDNQRLREEFRLLREELAIAHGRVRELELDRGMRRG